MSLGRMVTFVAVAASLFAAVKAIDIQSTLLFRVKECHECPNPEQYPYRLLGNKIRRYNRTTYTYSSDLVYPDVVDDDFKLILRFAVFGNGGWKDNFFVLNFGGICTSMDRYAPRIWNMYKAQIKQDCPIPAGIYTIKDIPTSFDVNWPVMQVHGMYKFTFEGYRMNKMILYKIFIAEVKSKKIRA